MRRDSPIYIQLAGKPCPIFLEYKKIPPKISLASRRNGTFLNSGKKHRQIKKVLYGAKRRHNR
jgi:hypothetical protein